MHDLVIEKLLELVGSKKYHFLWNLEDDDHRDKNKINLGWQAVSDELVGIFGSKLLESAGMGTVSAVRGKFRNIKSAHSQWRKLAKGSTGSGLNDVPRREYKWAKQMAFLSDADFDPSTIGGTETFHIAEATAGAFSSDEMNLEVVVGEPSDYSEAVTLLTFPRDQEETPVDECHGDRGASDGSLATGSTAESSAGSGAGSASGTSLGSTTESVAGKRKSTYQGIVRV